MELFLCIVVCGYVIVHVLLFRARLDVHLHARRAVFSHDARAAVQAVVVGTLCKAQRRINRQVTYSIKQEVWYIFAAQCCS